MTEPATRTRGRGSPKRTPATRPTAPGPAIGPATGPGELTRGHVRALRIVSLLLSTSEVGPARTPGGIVEWFGAMQAQDLASGKWSFGVRIPGASESDIDAAIERAEVLRTWPMRGTVHFVPPRDARWMVELMGPRALAGAAARRAYLGLTTAQVDKAVAVLGEALAGGRRATRSECVELLREAGIQTAGQHAYHLLWYVSQVGLTCMGPNVGNEGTFVLLDEWVPQRNSPDREEALGTMALRYFRSHGPTTHKDFAGWLGAPVADAKLGIAAAGDALAQVRCDGATMWVSPEVLDAVPAAVVPDPAGAPAADEVIALPGFDEFLLGFKDRGLVLDPEHKEAIIPGGNGVFQPTIVAGGRVIGTWRRTVRASRVELRPTLFAGVPKPRSRLRRGVERALGEYASYLGRTPDIRWPEPTS